MPDIPDNFSENEFTAYQLMPETTQELADVMDISVSYVYDIVESLRRKGVEIEQDNDGYYYDAADGAPELESAAVPGPRLTTGEKQSITREAKRVLAEMEYGLHEALADTEPAAESGGPTQRSGGTDLIIHRTDDHFGEHVTNQHGDEVFTSDIAESRVNETFYRALTIADMRRAGGVQFDTANLLLGGDMVTNESIYDGQAHEIDATLEEQIDRAASVYIRNIRRLSDEFPSVKVVCQPGNHGRIGGSGRPSNADNILYSMLDAVVRESSMDNVTFLRSDRSYYIDFQIRDWNAHLRHGHDASLEHIGTSAGKQRWLSWMVDHDFDVAFRGHYHMYKEEPINGVPVHMGGSIVPQTEFEESHAMSGRPVGAIHGANADAPTAWSEKIFFG